MMLLISLIKFSQCNMEKSKSSLTFSFSMLHNEAIDNIGLRKTEELQVGMLCWFSRHLTCLLQQF